MESSEANSDSPLTPESVIEHGEFPAELDDLMQYRPSQSPARFDQYLAPDEQQLKEEIDWMVELNLENLQNPFAGIESIIDELNQSDGYCSSVFSPFLKPMPPF